MIEKEYSRQFFACSNKVGEYSQIGIPILDPEGNIFVNMIVQIATSHDVLIEMTVKKIAVLEIQREKPKEGISEV